ncbi:MAG: YebC/PmpR family DNA-binding transcriptional regulator [Bacteroidota bacterium]
MGRIFEKRKEKMFKRYAKMAKAFTKIGRDIAIAVKLGGPNPESNPRLRLVLQNAKAVNMPKANVDAAIKRATEKNAANYEEVIYEAYAPHGIALIIETTTDNPTRTVANIRMHLNRGNGSLGTSGSVSFMFERKGIFKIDASGHNKEDLELNLIDWGAEDIEWDDEHNEAIVTTAFTDFGKMQQALEDNKIVVKETNKVFIPTTTVELPENQQQEVLSLIEKLEDDEDVAAVYHNMA